MGEKRDRDVEKVYSTPEFVAKLRRLADALEAGERFEIQVAGESLRARPCRIQRRARAGGRRGRARVPTQVAPLEGSYTPAAVTSRGFVRTKVTTGYPGVEELRK